MKIQEVVERNQKIQIVEFREKNFYSMITGMFWVGFAMVFSFFALDLFLELKNIQHLLITRGLTLLLELFLYFLLILNKKSRLRIKVISFFIFGVLAIYSGILTTYSGGWESIYWAGFSFILIFMLCLWPVSIKETSIFTLSLIVLYNLTIIVILRTIELQGFIKSNIFIFGTELIGITVAYMRGKQILELFDAHESVLSEKQKADNLLLNILPVEIANRLKSGETTISDYFDEVAILFSDIVGFTKFSSERNSKEIVILLNDLFFAFDLKCEELGIEKIKTIGDGYMAMAGGLKKEGKNILKIIELGDYMIQFIEKYGKEKNIDLKIRIGIHIGSVTAGVIGKTKFSFDIWGDTVNVASRMESSGMPMEIHITENVAKKLHDMERCMPRGEIEVKGKGRMKTYIINRYSRNLTTAST